MIMQSHSHPELGAKRKEKIEHDFFSITEDPYINIERVLAFDSLNRKAFEYKLAYLMLIKDYKGIASGLTKLESFGFNKIPVHLEEAAMVYRISNLGPMPDLGNLRINPQTEARFRQFLQTFQTYGNNLKISPAFPEAKIREYVLVLCILSLVIHELTPESPLCFAKRGLNC